MVVIMTEATARPQAGNSMISSTTPTETVNIYDDPLKTEILSQTLKARLADLRKNIR